MICHASSCVTSGPTRKQLVRSNGNTPTSPGECQHANELTATGHSSPSRPLHHSVALFNQRMMAGSARRRAVRVEGLSPPAGTSLVMTLAAEEVDRHFLIHILPDRFPRTATWFPCQPLSRQKFAHCRQLLIYIPSSNGDWNQRAEVNSGDWLSMRRERRGPLCDAGIALRPLPASTPCPKPAAERGVPRHVPVRSHNHNHRGPESAAIPPPRSRKANRPLLRDDRPCVAV